MHNIDFLRPAEADKQMPEGELFVPQLVQGQGLVKFNALA